LIHRLTKPQKHKNTTTNKHKRKQTTKKPRNSLSNPKPTRGNKMLRTPIVSRKTFEKAVKTLEQKIGEMEEELEKLREHKAERFELEKLQRIALHLTQTDYNLLKLLANHKKMDVQRLAQNLGEASTQYILKRVERLCQMGYLKPCTTNEKPTPTTSYTLTQNMLTLLQTETNQKQG